MSTIESLAADVAYLRTAVDELLRRVGGVPAQTYYPSAIPGQQVPKVTGNPSIDFTVAMLGGVPQPTPQRDTESWQAQHKARVLSGKYEANGISPEAAAFVYAASHRKAGTASMLRVYYEANLFSGRMTDMLT